MKMRIRCQYGFGVDLPDVAEIHYETHPDDGEEYCGLLLGYIVQANVDRVALPRPVFKVVPGPDDVDSRGLGIGRVPFVA